MGLVSERHCRIFIIVSSDGSRPLIDGIEISDESVLMGEEEWYRVKFELSVSLQMCKGAGGFFVYFEILMDEEKILWKSPSPSLKI